MESPKRKRATPGKERWYPYYAGFSTAFAADALEAAGLGGSSRVLDPWNGSGTTTQVAYDLGLQAVGYDLNPAMVVIARARLLGAEVGSSLLPLARRLSSGPPLKTTDLAQDPLSRWFSPQGAGRIRSLERVIRHTLTKHSSKPVHASVLANSVSSLAAFYYVALFRTVRDLLGAFKSSNPVWIKSPDSALKRLRPDRETIHSSFVAHVQQMARDGLAPPLATRRRLGTVALPRINVGHATTLPEPDASVDAIVTSPPYLTRIDYAISTLPELAILGHTDAQIRTMREQMLGTPLVPSMSPAVLDTWGASCSALLQSVRAHRSKASATYYYKTFLSYFDQLHRSLGEIDRVAKPGAPCIIVIQDSYYKELCVDLPLIASQMAGALDWKLRARDTFQAKNLLARTHPHARDYRPATTAREAVLTFSIRG